MISPPPDTPSSADWCNVLEPAALVGAFFSHPPAGFTSGTTRQGLPWFEARLDLLTTLDDGLRRRVRSFGLSGVIRSWLQWRTLFIGTTVSEYLLLPRGLQPELLPQQLLRGELDARRRAHQLLVVKDIPLDSPLLSAADVATARTLTQALHAAGFVMLQGQALAWLPIDFASQDEYLARLSHARRKNIRRKLRSRAQLDIRCLRTGDPWLSNTRVRSDLYRLYLQVYHQSETHFDLLSPGFFDAVLQDASSGGCLFVYRAGEHIVGWNLCFEFGDALVDKYIGLDYPRSRELNLYVVSWMNNLDYALSRGLKRFVAGWTDPGIKAELGARFTFTQHAVYPRKRIVRWLLRRTAGVFEGDRQWQDKHGQIAAGA